jgi:hypothetical protein
MGEERDSAPRWVPATFGKGETTGAGIGSNTASLAMDGEGGTRAGEDSARAGEDSASLAESSFGFSPEVVRSSTVGDHLDLLGCSLNYLEVILLLLLLPGHVLFSHLLLGQIFLLAESYRVILYVEVSWCMVSMLSSPIGVVICLYQAAVALDDGGYEPRIVLHLVNSLERRDRRDVGEVGACPAPVPHHAGTEQPFHGLQHPLPL